MTYEGTPIRNAIGLDADAQTLALQQHLLRARLANVQQLLPPTGRYNCFGLVFASRRTVLAPQSTAEFLEWMEDEKFGRVADCQEGDIVAYYDSRIVSHVGQVLSCGLGAPLVLSKWGIFGEFVHRINETARDFERHEFWRLGA